LGTAAGDSGDRIIYDSATGRIFYDADGSGGGAKVLFAKVTAGTTLTNADFIGFTAATSSVARSAETDSRGDLEASVDFSYEAASVLLGGEFIGPAHLLAQAHWSQMQQSSVDYFSA
jgi:hypothetical protein